MAAVHLRLTPYWRRGLIYAGLTLELSGCAHAPAWWPWRAPERKIAVAPAVPREPPPRARKPHHPHRAARQPAPPIEVAMIDPASLVGLKRPAVTRMLGAPFKTTKDEMSLVWIYAAEGCALRIYFYPDLKTSDFHVLKYTLAGEDGKTLEDDAPCRRKLLAVRDHDTG